MAFKMSPIGKKKCPYSPLQKRGLINPSPVMNNGDEKKVSSTKSSYQTGSGLTPEQRAEELRKLQELAQKTNQSQSKTFNFAKGGKAEDVWKTLSDEEKAKHGTVENFRKAVDEYNERFKETLTADPQIQNKTKSEIQSKAKPNTESKGTRLNDAKYYKGDQTQAQYEEVPIYGRVWDDRLGKYVRGITGYRQEKIEGTGGKKKYLDTQYTDVVNTKPGEVDNTLDVNRNYSSTGDDKDVKNYLDEQQAEAQQGLKNIRNEEVTVKSSGG